MPTAMVTFNGRITLPAQVRKNLGLKTGDNVDFVEVENGRYTICPRVCSNTEQDAEGSDLEFVPSIEEMEKVAL